MPKPVILDKIEIPEGEYLFCDPGCAAKEEVWDKAVADDMEGKNTIHTNIPCRFPDGEIGFLHREGNDLLAAYATLYGDGVYQGHTQDNRGITLEVDSGNLGVISKNLARDFSEIPTRFLLFSGPAEMTIDDHGKFALTRNGENLLEVATASDSDVTDEMYDEFRMCWLNDHIDGETLFSSLEEYNELCQDYQNYLEWLEENGFNSEIYPSLEEAERNNELGWSPINDRAAWLEAMEKDCAYPIGFKQFCEKMDAYASDPERAKNILVPSSSPTMS